MSIRRMRRSLKLFLFAAGLMVFFPGCQQVKEIPEEIPDQLPNPVRDFTQKDKYMIGLNWFRQRNFQIAAKFWKPLAAEGDCDAQYAMGLLYFDGLGVRGNYDGAFDLWSKSANQGQAQAQISLGVMYARIAIPYTTLDCKRGCDVEEDLIAAYKWFGIAVEIGAPQEQQMAQDSINRIMPHMSAEQVEEGDSLVKSWKPEPAQCDPRGVFILGS